MNASTPSVSSIPWYAWVSVPFTIPFAILLVFPVWFCTILSADPPQAFSRWFRGAFLGGGAFWERARFGYNAFLILVTLAMFALGTPHLRNLMSQNVWQIVWLAVPANLLYSFAYFAEVGLQMQPVSRLRAPTRWILFLMGTLFAGYLAGVFLQGPFQHPPSG